MIVINAGKVWAGKYEEDYLIINGASVAPVVFEEDDSSGTLCEAISAAGVSAEMVDDELVISHTEGMTIEGCLPNGVMPGGYGSINGLNGGVYE